MSRKMHYLVSCRTTLLFIALLAVLKVAVATAPAAASPAAASPAAASDYSIAHYTSQNGLPQNSAKGVELDKDGFLWIGTEAGLVRFDGQRFKLYDADHYPLMKSNRVKDLSLDTAGVLSFYDGALLTFDSRGRMQQISDEAYLGRIPRLQTDFLSVQDYSLLFLSGTKIRWSMILPELVAGGQGNFWAIQHRKCYFLVKPGLLSCVDADKRRTTVRITGLPPYLTSFAKDEPRVQGLLEHNGVLYYHTDKAIYQLADAGSNELKAILVLEADLSDVTCFRHYPGLNMYVIGTATHGVYILRRKQFEAHRHSNGYGNFYPQVPYGETGVLTAYGLLYPGGSRLGFPFDVGTFRGVLRDSRGHYWLDRVYMTSGTTYDVMLVEMDEKLRELKQRFNRYGSSCMRESPDGRIWILTSGGRRLAYVDGDSIRRLPEHSSINYAARTFLPAHNEHFWIAGWQMMALLNVRTGKQIHYKTLERYNIETLHLDRNKVLWVGTTGKGFYAIKEGRVMKLPLDKKASLKDVHSFMEDHSGFMWMSTNNGLFRCKKSDLDLFLEGKTTDVYYQCFKQESGFNTNEFNGNCTPSAIVLGNGKFSFPSIDGLVQFYPDAIKELLPVNKILVDKLLVDGEHQYPNGHSIDLQPNFKYIEVEVASPFYGNPANQYLEYRLIGLDSVWHPLSEDNKVLFNNLTHGQYGLQFRKRAGFGPGNIIMTSISLFVEPFFYQTIYFKLAALILAVLLIYLVLKIRYAYLLRHNKQLEQEVANRTFHLKNANRLKEKMLMMVGHDLQSPLHFLGYLSETNYEAVQANQNVKAGRISLEMKDTSRKIYAFVNEFSLWARVQDEHFNLKRTVFALSPMVGELEVFYKEILLLHHNTFEFTTEEEYELNTNKDLLKAILRNLIENAHKHTRNGIISIHCYRDGDETCAVRVSDTGKGMSPETLKRINELIDRVGPVTEFESGGRLGYQFIIDFVARLNARLTIDSVEGKGTEVAVWGIGLAHAENLAKKGIKYRK
ncbi:ligand-binding sensor domain-containing protein [Dyadobacter sp. MSC1_007]|jgi:signal transduction histidine kinase|uniref:ligand-binding sensor domain-containing protein n=1 Tax=Dyadobacter sp. MSC1_007 TaxID=2909264 RepID=UPI00202F5140|nr:two-component regulator propeller domain-containing protein [Dyadobacter sp. MSC1_007]